MEINGTAETFTACYTSAFPCSGANRVPGLYGETPYSVYAARVSMAKSSIRVENDKEVTLTPGMTVTVEIKTGSRRLIEYFLSPLLRGVQESIRER